MKVFRVVGGLGLFYVAYVDLGLQVAMSSVFRDSEDLLIPVLSASKISNFWESVLQKLHIYFSFVLGQIEPGHSFGQMLLLIMAVILIAALVAFFVYLKLNQY